MLSPLAQAVVLVQGRRNLGQRCTQRNLAEAPARHETSRAHSGERVDPMSLFSNMQNAFADFCSALSIRVLLFITRPTRPHRCLVAQNMANALDHSENFRGVSSGREPTFVLLLRAYGASASVRSCLSYLVQPTRSVTEHGERTQLQQDFQKRFCRSLSTCAVIPK
jgi:hypothetical protein